MISAKTYHRLLFTNGEYIRNKWVNGFSKLTLSNTINDVNEISLVNRILKVEEINESLNEILKHLGIRPENLRGRLNTSNHAKYQGYYTYKTKKIIEMQFASDIDYGKYMF